MSEGVTRGGVPFEQYERTSTPRTPYKAPPIEEGVTRRGKPINPKDIPVETVPPPTPIRGEDEGIVTKGTTHKPEPMEQGPAVDIEVFDCHDCGVNTAEIGEFYMIHHALWRNAIPNNPEAMLCIGCVEERLGFELTSVDFIDAPINRAPYSFPSRPDMERSDRLNRRLGIPEGSVWCWYHMRYEPGQTDPDLVCFECKHQFQDGNAMLVADRQVRRSLGWPEEELDKLTLSDVLACPFCAHDL